MADFVAEEQQQLSIPYDEAPFTEERFAPGESTTLYGQITFINETDQELNLRIYFDLPTGFHVCINGQRDFSVMMHHAYAIQYDGDFSLVALSVR